MAERGLSVDHTTIWRWTQAYGPEVHRRLRGNIKRKSSTWHVDETFVRIAGQWMYLFRAVDGSGQTVDFYLSETRNREAAKIFLKRAMANPDNRPLHVLSRDGLRSYPAAVRELQKEGRVNGRCRQRTGAIRTTVSSPIIAPSNAAYGRCKGQEQQRRHGERFKGSRRHR